MSEYPSDFDASNSPGSFDDPELHPDSPCNDANGIGIDIDGHFPSSEEAEEYDEEEEGEIGEEYSSDDADSIPPDVVSLPAPSSSSQFSKLPSDVLLYSILPYLQPRTVFRGIARTSSHFFRLATSDTLWFQWRNLVFCEEGIEDLVEDFEEDARRDDDSRILYTHYVGILRRADEFLRPYFESEGEEGEARSDVVNLVPLDQAMHEEYGRVGRVHTQLHPRCKNPIRKKLRCVYGCMEAFVIVFLIVFFLALVGVMVVAGDVIKNDFIRSVVGLALSLCLLVVLVVSLVGFCVLTEIWGRSAPKIGNEIRETDFVGYWKYERATERFEWVPEMTPRQIRRQAPPKDDRLGVGMLKGHDRLKLKVLSVVMMVDYDDDFYTRAEGSFAQFQFFKWTAAFFPIALIAAMLYPSIRYFASTKTGFGVGYFVAVFLLYLIVSAIILVRSLMYQDNRLDGCYFGALSVAVVVLCILSAISAILLSLVVEGVIPTQYVPVCLTPLFLGFCLAFAGFGFGIFLIPTIAMAANPGCLFVPLALVLLISPFCWCGCCVVFVVLVSLVFTGVVVFPPFFAYLPVLVMALFPLMLFVLITCLTCRRKFGSGVPLEMEIGIQEQGPQDDDGEGPEIRRIPQAVFDHKMVAK